MAISQNGCTPILVEPDIATYNINPKLIEEKMTYGFSKITFVIGGSNGLSGDVIRRSNYHMSFSKFTFPHQLMRLILSEQIYRALTIINNREYHK